MSISRKRVGSVSQRNDSPLPPLDIQSIQMPHNPCVVPPPPLTPSQNALALKTAALSSTKTLFQMASSLKKRLRMLDDFAPFLQQPPTAPQLDVVSHMCHVFRLGSSLCHIYNSLIPSFTNPSSPLYADLPSPAPLAYDFPAFMDTPDGVRNFAKKPGNKRACKRYIYDFINQMKQRYEEGRWHGEPWAVNELYGREGDDSEHESYDTSSLMKVFVTVEAMLDNLPDSCMSPISPTPTTPFGSSSQSLAAMGPMTSINPSARASYELAPSSGNGVISLDDSSTPPAVETPPQPSQPGNAIKTVEELVNSERQYVQELEILERNSAEILRAELVSAETCYSIFSNLRQILDFQRKFLIKLETEFEPIEERGQAAWVEGRWGRPFSTMEKEFECYGPYCANYMDAIQVVNSYMVNLMLGQNLPEDQRPCLHPERELQAFMIKPIQRITKYGLLLEAILNSTAKHEYAYRRELEEGIAAVRRIAADIDETTDIKHKQETVRDLVDRVDDWKGHDPGKFGSLYLDDQFTVSKADSPRDYHVFLFEKMMLCCKDIVPDKKAKSGKNSNMLRKDKTSSKSQIQQKPRLALKGRIFVSNITAAQLIPANPTEPYAPSRVQIVWSVPAKNGESDNDVEDSFIMSGRSEDQMKRWSEKVMELAVKARKKASERERARTDSRGYYQSQFAPPTPATDAQNPFSPATPGGANGYHYLPDEDDLDYQPPSGPTGLAIYGVPGVPFPGSASRRAQSQQSIPPAQAAELRTRAMTEDQNGPSMTQWRQQVPPLPQAPHLPRITSGASVAGSDSSWGTHGVAHVSSSQGASRRHPSQSRIDPDEYTSGPPGAYARYEHSSQRGHSRGGAALPAGAAAAAANGSLRNRSQSTPNVQAAMQAPLPPLPTSATHGPSSSTSSAWANANGGNVYPSGSATSSSTGVNSSSVPGGTTYFHRRASTGKRSSQESETTTETSETSSQSPRTPYTNTTSGDLRGATPVSRQNSQDAAQPVPTMLYIKVRCGESNFVIGMSSDFTFKMLYERVLKKLKNCSVRHATGVDQLVKIKWLDSDGDEVAIKTDADVHIMVLESADEQIQLIAA